MLRSLTYPLSVAAVVALGFWAYREGYETRAVEREVHRLERAIRDRERDIEMLRAEWAYLNRPDRLAALVELNWDALRLMPLTAEHFGHAGEVPEPPPPVIVADLDPEMLAATVRDIVRMRFEFGPEDGATLIAPPEDASDAEQVP